MQCDHYKVDLKGTMDSHDGSYTIRVLLLDG